MTYSTPGQQKKWRDTAWNGPRARTKALAALKVAVGCVDCGYNNDHRALQFDHVRGKKRYNVSQMVGCSLANLILELEKCDVRCGNCHLIRTAQDQEKRQATVDAWWKENPLYPPSR